MGWTRSYSGCPCNSRIRCCLGLPRRRSTASIIRIPGVALTFARPQLPRVRLAMTKKQLRILTERLLDAKSQLVRRIQRNRQDLTDSAGRPVRDSGDRILVYTRNSYLKGESSLLRLNLRQIEDALERIKLGTYGRCSECGRPIQEKRLSAVPWALLCVNCQKRKETGDLSRRQRTAFRLPEKNLQSTAKRIHQ
jgi:RNA polymerase-binding protein DksA